MITFNVTGMTCGGCAQAVTNAVHQVDPAASVEVDLGAKKAVVTSTASPDLLQSAIEAAGYQVSLQDGRPAAGKDARFLTPRELRTVGCRSSRC